MSKLRLSKFKSTWRLTSIVFLLTLTVGILQFKYAKAACPAITAPNGSVSQSFTVTTAGTYRVWSRIMPADTTNNSYTLDIDGTTCGVVVGGSSTLTAGSWSWVDYKSGTSTNKINVTLTTGTHTIKMYGTEPGVGLDRIMFISDTSCTPDNVVNASTGRDPGDNCVTVADVTPPTVSITSPTGGQISGTTTVTANAADAGSGINKVEFRVDGVLKNTDTTSPYSFPLDTSTLSIGNHTLLATAFDGSGNSTVSAPVTVSVADTSVPTVSLTSPTAGTVSGTISLAATASDNVAVTKVEFYIDGGTAKSTDNTSPYSASFDTHSLTNASHSVTAKAYDAAGNTKTSTAVNITVNNPVTPPPDTIPPVVSISNPGNGATLSGIYTISANATDAGGVTRVEFYINGNKVNTDTTAPSYTYDLDTSTLTPGTYSLYAIAYDAAGNHTQSTTKSFIIPVVDTFVDEDINQDGCVDILDASALGAVFDQTGSGLGRSDINNDRVVDILDASALGARFDASCGS